MFKTGPGEEVCYKKKKKNGRSSNLLGAEKKNGMDTS